MAFEEEVTLIHNHVIKPNVECWVQFRMNTSPQYYRMAVRFMATSIPKQEQLKTKSVTTVLNGVLASVYTQKTWYETHGATRHQTIANKLIKVEFSYVWSWFISFPQATTGLMAVSYRRPLLSTLLHVSFILTSHNRPRTYQLQRNATEHSSPYKFHSHKPQYCEYL
jgi:hypothetical protein